MSLLALMAKKGESLPAEVGRALESLRSSGSWALVGEYVLVRLPLGGSDRVVVGRIVAEKEVIALDAVE